LESVKSEKGNECEASYPVSYNIARGEDHSLPKILPDCE